MYLSNFKGNRTAGCKASSTKRRYRVRGGTPSRGATGGDEGDAGGDGGRSSGGTRPCGA